MGALVIPDSDGLTFLSNLNTALAQLGTQNAGNSRPADAGAGTIWVDKNTPSASIWSVFLYDGADDILLGYVNTTTNVFSPANALLAGMGKGAITGLTYANNGSDPTNDIDIAAGWCMDATGARQMQFSALTKRLDAAWAVGTNQGGLDTGSIGNNDYYIWAIVRSDTGVTDILFSLSATAPSTPANYDYKRLIGWFKRVSATIVPFTTRELEGGGIEQKWTTPTLDVDTSALSTSRRTDAVKVPLDFKTDALLRTIASNNSGAASVIVCDPAEADQAPSLTVSPGATHRVNAAGNVDAKDMEVTTSATGTVAARADAASTIYRVWTRGFRWSRR